MGNIFAIYAGQDSSLAPIGMGSHLDTQPAGYIPRESPADVKVDDMMVFSG